MKIHNVLSAYSKGIQHIIVAPHPDDEIIGCFEIIAGASGRGVHVVHVIPYGSSSSDPEYDLRLHESNCAFERVAGFGCKAPGKPYICGIGGAANFLFDRMPEVLRFGSGPFDELLIYWFPDPDFETHIHHKLVGSIGRELLCITSTFPHNTTFASKMLCGFYSINMKAPYVTPLSKSASEEKRRACQVFKSQKDFFEHHQESWIFEGRYIV